MKKSQLKNIIRESIKGLMNEQTGLTCYTCINGTIYSTNAFTSTTGPYPGGGDAGIGINICGQVPLATGISYTSFTGTFNIGTTVGNDLVFFDNPSTPYFTALGCKLPSRPDPVDPCDKDDFINYITTNYPQFANPAGYEIAHFCEECNDNQGHGPSPISGFDPMCKCCKKKAEPTDKERDIERFKKLANIKDKRKER